MCLEEEEEDLAPRLRALPQGKIDEVEEPALSYLGAIVQSFWTLVSSSLNVE
jgi:hypothetical protein